jgi:Glycosyl transferase family 2
MAISTLAISASAGERSVLVLLTLGLWVAASAMADARLVSAFSVGNSPLSIGAIGTVLFGLHAVWLTLAHCIACLFLRTRLPQSLISHWEASSASIPVALLLCTRDDWAERAARSALTAMRPCDHLFICDDSESPQFRLEVDAFAERHRNVSVVRRGTLNGYKAGNLNHCLKQLSDRFPFFLVLDHDNEIHSFTLWQGICQFTTDDNLAFVQFSHKGPDCAQTSFCEDMRLAVRVAWSMHAL